MNSIELYLLVGLFVAVICRIFWSEPAAIWTHIIRIVAWPVTAFFILLDFLGIKI
jgi:hypothetical protein